MSLLKVNEVQNYNGSSLTLTASTVSTSAQLNTGGNISVTGSINVSDDSTTRSNLGLGSIATQDSSNVSVTGGSITGTTIVPTSPFSFTNKIINGNFDIWQRGTSQTSSGYGSADRWQNYHDTSTKTASQQSFTLGQTDVPGNPKYYLRHVITTGGGANDRVLTNQKIEDVSILAGKTFTFSFWAKADSSKNIAIEVVQNFGTGGSPTSAITGIGVTTHSLTTSWQKFTGTVSIPSISGKTIGSDGNDYTSFAFWFDAGSTYNSRTNSLGNQSGTFDIAQVQLEEGSVATPFEHRPYGVELALCQRYYEVIPRIYVGLNNSSVNFTHVRHTMTYATQKRISNPTVTYGTITSGFSISSLLTNSSQLVFETGHSGTADFRPGITTNTTISAEL